MLIRVFWKNADVISILIWEGGQWFEEKVEGETVIFRHLTQIHFLKEITEACVSEHYDLIFCQLSELSVQLSSIICGPFSLMTHNPVGSQTSGPLFITPKLQKWQGYTALKDLPEMNKVGISDEQWMQQV